MTRFFYTDPLAAAWMAKQHGFHLYTGHFQDDMDAYSAINWWHCLDDARYRFEHAGYIAKFIIQPDSLPLLSPKYGDLVSNTHDEYNRKHRPCSGLMVGFLNKGKDAYISTGERHNGKSEFCEQTSAIRIVQRNGIAFMWPEGEAA